MFPFATSKPCSSNHLLVCLIIIKLVVGDTLSCLLQVDTVLEAFIYRLVIFTQQLYDLSTAFTQFFRCRGLSDSSFALF